MTLETGSNLTWSEVRGIFYKQGADDESAEREREESERCWNCGREGHSDLRCPLPHRCYICLQTSHEAHQCILNPVEGSVAFNTKELCGICGERGHARTRCKSEGGPLHQRAGLNLAKQTVFSKPLVIKVREDSGPPSAQVNAAREGIIHILQKRADRVQQQLNQTKRQHSLAVEASIALSPSLGQQASNPSFSASMENLASALSMTQQPTQHDGTLNSSGVLLPPGSRSFDTMADIDLYCISMRLLGSSNSGLTDREARLLKQHVSVLRQVVASVGFGAKKKAALGGPAGGEPPMESAIAAHFADENMLHELKVSSLDFHIVFGGKVEQYMRGKGESATVDAGGSGAYEPVGGKIKEAEELLTEFHYNPQVHGHKAQKQRAQQQQLRAQREGSKKPKEPSAAANVRNRVDVLGYALAEDPTDSPRRFNEGRERLKEVHDTKTFVPQAPKANSRRAMSARIVNRWSSKNREVTNPRLVKSIRVKDSTFSKETYVKIRPLPTEWTDGGTSEGSPLIPASAYGSSRDLKETAEEFGSPTAFDQFEKVDLLPISVLKESDNEEETIPAGGGDVKDGTFMTSTSVTFEASSEGPPTGLSRTQSVAASGPTSRQTSSFIPAPPSFSEGAVQRESAVSRSHQSSPRRVGSLRRSGSGVGASQGNGLKLRDPATGSPTEKDTSGLRPGAGGGGSDEEDEPPIKNWDVYKTLQYKEDSQQAKKECKPQPSRVNVDAYNEGAGEKSTPLVVNPYDVTAISSRWRPRFHSTKLQKGFAANEMLSARSSLRRIAASSPDQLALCATNALAKGRQWSVSHGISKDIGKKKTPIPPTGSTPFGSGGSTIRSSLASPRPYSAATTRDRGPSRQSLTSPRKVQGKDEPRSGRTTALQSPRGTTKSGGSASSGPGATVPTGDGIWTDCCLKMAESAAQHHQREYVYRNLRSFMQRIKAPHTHQGHRFVNAFIDELAAGEADLTPAMLEAVVALQCPEDTEAWTLELSDLVAFLRAVLPEVC